MSVRWRGSTSSSFHPTRGTKQGSLISPLSLNIYINEMLHSLQEDERGLRIGNECFNHVAYADDITLVAAQPADLQDLMNLCTDYADKWRFSYGLKKTMCMVAGRCPFVPAPTWQLKGYPVEVVDAMTILGVSFPIARNTQPSASVRHAELCLVWPRVDRSTPASAQRPRNTSGKQLLSPLSPMVLKPSLCLPPLSMR